MQSTLAGQHELHEKGVQTDPLDTEPLTSEIFDVVVVDLRKTDTFTTLVSLNLTVKRDEVYPCFLLGVQSLLNALQSSGSAIAGPARLALDRRRDPEWSYPIYEIFAQFGPDGESAMFLAAVVLENKQPLIYVLEPASLEWSSGSQSKSPTDQSRSRATHPPIIVESQPVTDVKAHIENERSASPVSYRDSPPPFVSPDPAPAEPEDIAPQSDLWRAPFLSDAAAAQSEVAREEPAPTLTVGLPEAAQSEAMREEPTLIASLPEAAQSSQPEITRSPLLAEDVPRLDKHTPEQHSAAITTKIIELTTSAQPQLRMQWSAFQRNYRRPLTFQGHLESYQFADNFIRYWAGKKVTYTIQGDDMSHEDDVRSTHAQKALRRADSWFVTMRKVLILYEQVKDVPGVLERIQKGDKGSGELLQYLEATAAQLPAPAGGLLAPPSAPNQG
ncbi:uncharacterized protein B0H18DRAFT_1124545 [Fomitopsis serialis]|uniref:uncharacterized protein n=1 Tax=Fomitopsis serialis TaxID=139415 RepID=UPI0020076E83|nr:uncharacterized protein B0H18DRAFT_1124545 [Neoantrodia serialis]KAH9916004.1 hypothetical protein B0H18DRAFT_1124545 [Neoantrodia serialis]